MRILSLISIFIGLSLQSCREDPAFIEPDLGYDYLPLVSGAYIIYDVDSIVYNDFTRDTDRYSYQIKEEVGEFIEGNANEENYELLRYYR